MRKRIRSPQEKKALSYAKDRRNTYGENDKSSRKNIPLSKAKAKRAVRQADRIALRVDPLSDDIGFNRQKAKWRKSPDGSLGEVLERREVVWPSFHHTNLSSDALLSRRLRAFKRKQAPEN